MEMTQRLSVVGLHDMTLLQIHRHTMKPTLLTCCHSSSCCCYYYYYHYHYYYEYYYFY